MVTTMRLSWVLCLVMVHLPMDTRVSGEPGTQRRGEKNQTARCQINCFVQYKLFWGILDNVLCQYLYEPCIFESITSAFVFKVHKILMVDLELAV